MNFQIQIISNKTVENVVDFVEQNEDCTIEIVQACINEIGLLCICLEPYYQDESSVAFTNFAKNFSLWLFN